MHSVCTNHCDWSLCFQHIDEHRILLETEFEQVLDDLIKPTNEFSKIIEQTKQNIKKNQQEELDHLRQFHQNQMEIFDPQLIQTQQFQKQYNQISENLIKIKNNENLLIHNDFQQINNLLQQINQFKNSLTDIQEIEKEIKLTYCPLTSLNIFGLCASHNVRLCGSQKQIRHLFEHFRNYHHLTPHYANELVNALAENLDPVLTKIFPSNSKIIDPNDKIACPFHNTSSESGIRRTPCTNMITKRFLSIHLKSVHHLRVKQIKEIMKET
ncbi:unnamed protein product [Adineta steineri]|uniref:Uncharacterized protein n=1 Tax=Adineta steineri TaxID=433720 RepID=A0A819UZH7_9BILA|nr:unnamed protein product [Adineta steineri]